MSKIGSEPSRQAEGRKIEHIGILTGGGDCPGLNAVIRSVTKAAAGSYGYRVTGILDGFDGLIHKRTVDLTYENVRGIINLGGTLLGSNNKANPFAYKTRNNQDVKTQDLSAKVIDNIASIGLDALIVVGGDGTMKIGYEFSKLGVPVVGVPKTIDNDLMGTDRTFGFDTAVNTSVEAIDKIRTTAESHHRVMIVEVMGRTAGWIALAAGIAGGADIILIPEIPYDIDAVYSVIDSRMSKKRTYSIVVVAEGAKPKGGSEIIKMFVKDSAEPVRLGGVGYRIAEQIMEKLNIDARATILGHTQRGGSPIASDRVLGTRLGFHAVELAAAGEFGRMSALQGTKVTSVTLKEATKHLKRVDPEGEIVRCARNVGVSFGDRA